MNSQLAEVHHIYKLGAEVRDGLLDSLEDSDLGFEIPGNPIFGLLWAEHAAVERSYVDSFKTFQQDWSLGVDASLGVSVERLKAEFKKLDAELVEALEAISDADVQTKLIDRGGWGLSVGAQVHTLREALIIVMGKATVYLRAMGKIVPQRVIDWVG